MFRLPLSLAAWPSKRFPEVLKREIESVDVSALPLQAGLSATSYVFGNRFSVMVLRAEAGDRSIRARIGVFYEGITAGCNCADDPSAVAPQGEYCEIELSIDDATAEAVARLG
jgi:hypothetical protein